MAAARLHADEVDVDDELVRRLLRAQFPAAADLPLHRAPSSGTDNAVYRLGNRLGVRLPRIHWAAPQVVKEHEWLPRLAPHLPAPVPEPVALGAPGCGYPYPWLISRWLDGDDALTAGATDWPALAHDAARFVTALHRIDPDGAPPARGRGGPLAAHDDETRRAIAALADEIDVDRVTEVWEAALAAAPWARQPVWVHGDLLLGNLILRDGRLRGVIDWSSAGVGDPACDAMLAWSLPADARAVYRAATDLDDATWARARGWTVQQAVLFIPYYAATIPDAVAVARRRLAAALADDT